MAGPHQADNAALAVAMLRYQNAITVPESALAAAMEWTRWPARMQRLAKGPLTDLLPEGTDVWLDGGHNVDAGLAVAAHFATDDRRIHLITGMLANKDPSAIIAPLSEKIASISVLPIAGHDHHDASAFGLKAISAPEIDQAIQSLKINSDREIVLIAGSLYLAGEVLKANNQIPE
jgi:dihydrofolate synthase/folylpolyglutamate synthase